VSWEKRSGKTEKKRRSKGYIQQHAIANIQKERLLAGRVGPRFEQHVSWEKRSGKTEKKRRSKKGIYDIQSPIYKKSGFWLGESAHDSSSSRVVGEVWANSEKEVRRRVYTA